MFDILARLLAECWLLLGQMAPYLLFGFLMAGVLSVFIPPQWVERHLGGRGLAPVLKATLIGIPLPLCSCAVIPVTAAIRRHGASRAAAASFLLSTPQTGVDSIAVTYALLGPLFAAFRPIAALLTGLVGGALVQLFGEPDHNDAAHRADPSACAEPCCTRRHAPHAVVRALRYGLVTLPRDVGVSLVLGIAIAVAVTALLPPGELRPYLGGGIVSMALMVAAGIPVYVCATASVAIAAGMIHLGASPGAALAFLIAGPATNAATITTVWKLLGWRTTALYLLTIALSAIVCGLLLDGLFAALRVAPPLLGSHQHGAADSGWLEQLGAIALLAVLAYSFWSRSAEQVGAEQSAAEDGAAGISSRRRRVELAIGGMTCSHCVESVSRALSACAGVESAQVSLPEGRAVVVGGSADPAQLAAAVTALGFSATASVQPPLAEGERNHDDP